MMKSSSFWERNSISPIYWWIFLDACLPLGNIPEDTLYAEGRPVLVIIEVTVCFNIQWECRLFSSIQLHSY